MEDFIRQSVDCKRSLLKIVLREVVSLFCEIITLSLSIHNCLMKGSNT